MLERTRRLWQKQYQLVGDRRALFAAVRDAVDAKSVLYPGSYVDITPSLIWPSVTYVDVDRRANQLFADEEGVQELLLEQNADSAQPRARFIHADYNDDLELRSGSFDLLISLYAGFVSESCIEYLRKDGTLLVNASHGDAAMASIDPRCELTGVLVSDSDGYHVETHALDSYLVPKKDVELTAEFLQSTGRGVPYTRSPFAYLFTRVS